MVEFEQNKNVEILLIEDNPGDVRLTIEALKDCKIVNNLNVVENGLIALEYLRHEGEYKDKQLPDLILLDLNIPKINGHEVLTEIKTDKKLKVIPVVILTSSSSDEDILKTYELHANCFITKPVNIEQFVKVVQSVGEFWFSIVKLPQDEEKRIHNSLHNI
jgi:CheY-like chemotaxis protein